MPTTSNAMYDSTGPKIRYALFGINIFLYILTILLTILLPGFGTGSIINGSFIILIGIIMLVYYPLSIYFSWKNKKTRYDQAGGEVAVEVLISAAWLGAAIYEIMYAALEFCADPDSGWYYEGVRGCQASAIALSVLYTLNFVIHTGWTAWIITLVHKNSKGPFERAQVYTIPSHYLVKGKFAIENFKNPNSVGEEDRGLYNHRL